MSTLVNVCKLGHGEQVCRYLVNNGDWRCGKLMPDIKAAIDHRFNTGNPLGAKGNNCEGKEGELDD